MTDVHHTDLFDEMEIQQFIKFRSELDRVQTAVLDRHLVRTARGTASWMLAYEKMRRHALEVCAVGFLVSVLNLILIVKLFEGK